jgi:hypothetical protein
MMRALEALPGLNRRWLPNTKHETLAEFYENWRLRRSFRDRLRLRNPRSFRAFGFVRNPWDRMSSYYYYLKERRPIDHIDSVNSFPDFLEMANDGVEWIKTRHAMRPQTDFFTFVDRAGQRLMRLDYLGHFEHLIEDVADITRQLGVCITLGHMNQSTNARQDYRREYTDRMFEIVGNLFADDARLFGYEPSQRQPKNRYSGPLNQSY